MNQTYERPKLVPSQDLNAEIDSIIAEGGAKFKPKNLWTKIKEFFKREERPFFVIKHNDPCSVSHREFLGLTRQVNYESGLLQNDFHNHNKAKIQNFYKHKRKR